MPSLKEIYKSFNLRFDVREARKLLKLDKKTDRLEVNRLLRNYYKEIEDEAATVYQYTLTGTSRQQYNTKKGDKLAKPDTISFTFQSRAKLNIKKGNYTEGDIIADNDALTNAWLKLGSGYDKTNTITNVSRRKITDKKRKLKDVPLFNCIVDLPYKEFNGFRDTGVKKCVPETLLHHLQLKGENKKLTLNKIIDILNEIECKIPPNYEEDGEPELPEELEEQGYTAEQIVIFLERFKCKARMLDIERTEFLTSSETLKVNTNLLVFVGIVYNNHLYYCDDKKFVKSLGEKCKKNTNGGFDTAIYDKNIKERVDNTNYEVIETNDLKQQYIDLFNQDNTIKLVKTENGKITKICIDDNHSICANPDKTIMVEIMGDEFKNGNLSCLGDQEFKDYYPNHIQSKFNKDVFDKLTIHGNIVMSFNKPKCDKQDEYDINKCRTDCWFNNILGDYEVFNYDAKIEECNISCNYERLEHGIYYVVIDGKCDFFMKGSGWYSSQYIKESVKEGFEPRIRYKLLAQDKLPHNHFKPFVNMLVKKYPSHFKHIVNRCVGQRGKTNVKRRTGYIETDFELAVSAFWENNDDKIGFLCDDGIDKRIWKQAKGNLASIHPIEIGDTTQYIVEKTTFKTLYENDLPIYNKVLENEFLRVYRLKKEVGGRLIAIKTDAVIVECGKKPKLSTKIGGIKYKEVKVDKQFNHKIPDTHTFDVNFKWNITRETETGVNAPSNCSYLVTGLAGFGKSYFVKSQPEYDDITTIRLAFTNVASENLQDEEHASFTLNSYFGIDFNGKCSEKKLKRLKAVKCIMISEVFMTPSSIMGFLGKIKIQFPDIKFIVEGDPFQLRPVKQEHINWLETPLLHNICDGNLIELTINKRSNETDNYHKIIDGTYKPIYQDVIPKRINLTYTNECRVNINTLCMNKNDYIHNIKYNSEKHYIKGQDVYLNLETPIMGIKTDKKTGIKNGKMYSIDGVDTSGILINDNFYTDDQFMNNFVVAYAMTTSKCQGITIREPYNIYEWKKMDWRLKYTSYSRTIDAKNIAIIG